MTNGEKIKEIFPNAEIDYGLRGVVAVTFIHKTIFDLDWWNAEYKEPITENCIACKYGETEEEDGEHCKKCLEGDSQFALGDDVMDIIRNSPSVTQKPKIGHWIETHDDWGNGIITDRKYKCSVCHGKHIDPEMGEWHEVFDYKYPFCPNCGAKMEEVEE